MKKLFMLMAFAAMCFTASAQWAGDAPKKTAADMQEEKQIKAKNFLLNDLNNKFQAENPSDHMKNFFPVKKALKKVFDFDNHYKSCSTSTKWVNVPLTTPKLKEFGKVEKMTYKCFFNKEGKDYVVQCKLYRVWSKDNLKGAPEFSDDLPVEFGWPVEIPAGKINPNTFD